MSWRVIILSIGIIAMVACERRQPPWIDVPVSSRLPYELKLATYDDGDIAGQPFDLMVIRRGSTPHENCLFSKGDCDIILRAEQCENVLVIAKKDFLYIFYSEIAIKQFGSFTYGKYQPRRALCDIASSFCRDLYDRLSQDHGPGAQVCTFEGQQKQREEFERKATAKAEGSAPNP